MSEEKTNIDAEKPAEDPANVPETNTNEASEFKVTVRKLEMPIRPRGVLAE